jgi:hypothetical protein
VLIRPSLFIFPTKFIVSTVLCPTAISHKHMPGKHFSLCSFYARIISYARIAAPTHLISAAFTACPYFVQPLYTTL